MRSLLCAFLTVYIVVLFGRIIMSWFPIQPGSGLAGVYRILYDLTEPVMAPLRALIPPVGGSGMAFDLSPIILFIGIQIIQSAVLGC
jgi:YggT family protein